LPQFDVLYEKLQTLPDGPERIAVFRKAEGVALAYMPYKNVVNRLTLDMTQKRVIGYRRPVFWQDWWHFVDIDDGAGAAAKKA
jgi:ABC-type transport system substrate-binding protein